MLEQNSSSEVMRAIENRIHNIQQEDPQKNPEEIRREILNFLMDEGQ